MHTRALSFGLRPSTPVILQSEAAECGLACLGMVASHHGFTVDLASLRRRFPVSMKGLALHQMMEIASALHLSPRALRLELDHLSGLKCPAILHWEFNHFVVLTAARDGSIEIHDPARGRRTVSMSECSRSFTGVALELTPTDAFSAGDQRRTVRLRELIGRVRGLAGTFALVIVLSLLLQLFIIAGAWFVQWLADNVLVSGDHDHLTVLGVGFLLLAAARPLVGALRSWILVYAGTHLNLHLVTRLFGRLLRLPMTFFERRHLGDVMSRFESMRAIQRTLTNGFVEAIVDGGVVTVTLAVMLLYSWKLAGIALVAAVLYCVLNLALYRKLRELTEEQIVKEARQTTNFLETVRGVQSVKLFNREAMRHAVYQNLAVDHLNAGVRTQRVVIVVQAANGLLFGIENVVVIWVGGLLALEGGLSIGMLLAFLAYKDQFAQRVGNLVDKLVEFRMLGLQAERVADIALGEAEQNAEGGLAAGDEVAGSIEVEGVSLRYGEREPFVLRGVAFSVRAGESVAIVGPSGCGKSTLVKAMLGVLPVSEGQISIGGMPLSKLGTLRQRQLIGTVMQEDQLFAGSIADNISFFDPTADIRRILECAQLACVHDEMVAMPMGYNTLVGDMGTVLSGGQKQRILLARALYKNPKILFLDEATSHLDVERERAVNAAIRSLKITRVIVAHRPETIASADRVISLTPSGAFEVTPLPKKRTQRSARGARGSAGTANASQRRKAGEDAATLAARLCSSAEVGGAAEQTG